MPTWSIMTFQVDCIQFSLDDYPIVIHKIRKMWQNDLWVQTLYVYINVIQCGGRWDLLKKVITCYWYLLNNGIPWIYVFQKRDNCFQVVVPWRTFYFCADTREEQQDWMLAIQGKLVSFSTLMIYSEIYYKWKVCIGKITKLL